jgi:hypothetical protein
MEEDLDIRQNKDLIQSLNEIYQMNIQLQKDLFELKKNYQNDIENQNEKIRQMNNLIIKTSNNYQQKLSLQSSFKNNYLDEVPDNQIEIELLKDDNQLLHEKLKNLNNDILLLQNHIIQNSDEIPDLTDLSINKNIRESSSPSSPSSHMKEITNFEYHQYEMKDHPFNTILNPITKR